MTAAKMEFKVNCKALHKDLIAKCDKLAKFGLRSKGIIEAMGEEAFKLSLENAHAHKNVKGRPWKKPKKKGSTMNWIAGSIRVIYENLRFKIVSISPWGIYHIKGAKNRLKKKWKLPARSFAPKTGNIAPSWQSVLQKAVDFIDGILK